MLSLFSFSGKVSRLPYALWSLGIFFSQYLVVLATSGVQFDRLKLDGLFYVMPFRPLVMSERASSIGLILGLAYLVLAAWALSALAFRRAADADVSEWTAGWVVAPVIQIPVILFLCVMPSYAERDRATPEPHPGARANAWAAAAQGIAAGVAVTLLAVAVGALIFGTYGYGVFVFTPFVVGAVTAYLANRTQDIGGGSTALLVTAATLFGGIALIGVALEGAVCLAMAAPLGIVVALIGGALGRAIALLAQRPTRETLSCVALLPLVFAVEHVLPPLASFDSYQTIAVRAPPEAVWKSLLATDPIEGAPALPFRLGMAYPLRGEIIGEGVGAVRRGEFSTGTAIERITEWEPNRKLAFVVVEDIPAMRELSPYEHVHAPHVAGYFRTTLTSFELVPRSDGGTDIIELTSHELRLDPVLYWLPMARLAVRENNARVLTHLRRHAERSVRLAAEESTPTP